MKILANDGIDSNGKVLLEDAGFEVDTNKIPQDELISKLNDYDVVIVRSATKITEELIDASPNLKVICRAGVGLDNVAVERAKEKGIPVYNTPAASSNSVAELVFGHIIAISRFLHLSNREMPLEGTTQFKTLKKNYSEGIELRGKTLGICGLGRIGREVARIGLALGMEILAVDLFVDEAEIDVQLFDNYAMSLKQKLQTVDMDTMLSQSDMITCHVPSLDKPLIGTAEIAKMKDGAILVNASRGGIIDEDALLKALDSGKLMGAGLDVFVGEPTPRKELLTHPKISVTPHTGASTMEAQKNIGTELAEKIIGYFDK